LTSSSSSWAFGSGFEFGAIRGIQSSSGNEPVDVNRPVYPKVNDAVYLVN
jgi:hypothetical protein